MDPTVNPSETINQSSSPVNNTPTPLERIKELVNNLFLILAFASCLGVCAGYILKGVAIFVGSIVIGGLIGAALATPVGVMILLAKGAAITGAAIAVYASTGAGIGIVAGLLALKAYMECDTQGS